MAHCVHCGKKLPIFTLGRAQDSCADCRKTAPQVVRPLIALNSATVVLIAMNVLVFVAMVLRGISPIQPTIQQLLASGADFGPLTLGGQWWRVLTSTFVHMGIIHLGFNMWCLLDLGIIAETLLGRGVFVAVYLLSGIAGSVLSLAWHPMVVSAGASGAIFGIAGLLIALIYVRKTPSPFSLRPKSLLIFVGYNLVLGLRLGVDNAAHLGGLAAGVLLGLAVVPLVAGEHREQQRNPYVLSSGAILLVLVFSMVHAKNTYAVEAWKGVEATQHGDWKEAERQLKLAAAKRPDEPVIQSQLCYALEKNESPEAEACLKRAAAMDTESSFASHELGWLYIRNKRYAEAKEAFTRLSSAAPYDADAHVGMGAALAGLGTHDDAKKEFEAAIFRDPKLAKAHYWLGSEQLQDGRYEAAIASLTRAAQLDTNDAQIQQALGAAYQGAGRQQDADTAFRRAAELEKR